GGAELGRVAGGQGHGDGLVGPVAAVVGAAVGVLGCCGGARRERVDVRGGAVHALLVAGVVGREVLDRLPVAAQHRLAGGVIDRAARVRFGGVGVVVGLGGAGAAGVARRERDGHVVVDKGGGHVVAGRGGGAVDVRACRVHALLVA